jgi:hypothetical protein
MTLNVVERDKPQERVQPRNEDNTAKLIKKKRRLEAEKYGLDSLSEVTTIAEEHQLDRIQETPSSVDSPTNN